MGKGGSERYFFEHLDPDFPSGYLTKRSYRGFVFALDLGRMPLAEHARAVGRCQDQLETIWDLRQAVFNSDTRHEILRKFEGGLDDVQGFEGVKLDTQLHGKLEALGMNDCFEIKQRTVKQLVNYNEVEMLHLLYFFRCIV